MRTFAQSALTIGLTAALLADCGGSQPRRLRLRYGLLTNTIAPPPRSQGRIAFSRRRGLAVSPREAAQRRIAKRLAPRIPRFANPSPERPGFEILRTLEFLRRVCLRDESREQSASRPGVMHCPVNLHEAAYHAATVAPACSPGSARRCGEADQPLLFGYRRHRT